MADDVIIVNSIVVYCKKPYPDLRIYEKGFGHIKTIDKDGKECILFSCMNWAITFTSHGEAFSQFVIYVWKGDETEEQT